MACDTCGGIPGKLVANTGRDESLPKSVSALFRLELKPRDQDLYRCPACGALFHWTEDVAFTGSGNNDSEELVRLGEADAAIVRSLLDLSDRADRPDLLKKAYASLSGALVGLILGHLYQNLDPTAFAALVPELVEQLMRSDDWTCSGLLEGHCGKDRERTERVSLLLLEDARPKGDRAQTLLWRFAKTLAQQ